MQDERGLFETEEVDLLFTNIAHEDGLGRFEPEILVEAKNWSSPVDAIEISWFATKMRRRNCRTGVLVAALGITGDRARLTAARQQVMLALNEGQQVLVLTRKELEAVSSGERLAQLLHKKRDHLIARQDIYEAEADELRLRSGAFRLGSEAFSAMLRGERLLRIEEAQACKARLPDGDIESAQAIRAVIDEVEPLLAADRNDPDQDPRGEGIREALMKAAALCVAWLAHLGFEEANTILLNGATTGLDRLRPTVGTRLWLTLANYFVDELGRESPEMSRETLLFSLTCMLVEEIWRLDEYWPEPDEY